MGMQFRGPGFGRDVAVDLGSTWVRAAVSGKGICLQEPALAAVDRQSGQVLQVGEQARLLLGRTPGQLVAVRPVREGGIADYTAAVAVLRAVLRQVLGSRFGKPRLLLSVSPGASEVEERALLQAGLEAGARRVYLMESPLAALAGAGADPTLPQGRMVVSLGGGVCDSAIIALNGMAASDCLAVGGDAFDEALIHYVRHKHALLLGLRTAQQVKESIGQADEPDKPDKSGKPLTVKGRCLNTGLPRDVSLTPAETAEAFLPVTNRLLASVQSVLERTPPELAADVAQSGILLTGGGSLLRGLDKKIAAATGIWAMTAQEPDSCVILGLEKALAGLHERPDGLLNLARHRQLGGAS